MRTISGLLAITVFSLVFSASCGAGGLTLLTEDSPPANYVDVEGNLTGVSVELVREAMRRLGVSLEIEVLPWARAYDLLLTGPDTALFSTTRTKEREKRFFWAGPLVRAKWAFYAKRGTNMEIESLDDARRVGAIGTYTDDAREQFLESRGFSNLAGAPDNVLNVKKLMAGRIDLMVGTNLGMGRTARDAGVPPGFLKEVYVIRTADLYLAFSRDVEQKRVGAWRAAFAAMHADGTFERIYRDWLPGQEVPPLSAD